METIPKLESKEDSSDLTSHTFGDAESNRRYRRLLDLLPDCVVIHYEGIIELVNNATMRAIRVTTEEEILGKHILDFVHPDYHTIAIERHESMVNEGDEFPSFEEIIIRADGTEFYAEASGSVVPYDGKKAIQVVFRDVSERKVAYEKMRLSEESFRVMFDRNPIPMGIFDRDTFELLEVNASFVNLYGYTRIELLGGMTSKDIRPREDIPEFIQFMKKLEHSEEQSLNGTIWRHLKKNGDIIIVQIISNDIVFNNRPARHVLINDITDYKKSKSELLKANERFEMVVQATTDVIWDIDIPSDTIWWNDNFYSKFGYKKDGTDSISTSWSDNIYPQDKEEVLSGIQQCIDEQQPFWTAEYRFLKQDKKVVHILDRGYIQYGAGGNPKRIVGAMLDITEQKKYQEELQISQSRLRCIFESAMDAIITVDDQYNIILFNSAAEKIFLCTADEVIGQSIERLIPDRFHEIHTQHLADYGAITDQYHTIAVTHDGIALRTNGMEFPIEASISQVQSETGTLYNVILRDVTEKKIASDRLQQSEEKFRAVVQNISDIITIIDDTGIILYKSPSVKEILGYGQEELLGRNVFEFIHPDDKVMAASALQEVLQTEGKSKRFEFKLLAKNNEYVILESSGNNQTSNPAIGGLVVTSRDMTERKRSEDILRSNEEKFRAILENSKVGFTLFDHTGNVLYVSPTNEQIFGYSQADLLSMNHFDMLHPEDKEKTITRLQCLLKGEEVFPTEFRWLMKDGKWKWIVSNAFNYLETKNLNAILVTYQDVNQRHESNAQIRNQAALLDIVPDAIIMQELNGIILSWNKGAQKMYGWLADEVIGKSFIEILRDSEKHEFDQRLDYLLHHGKWSGDLLHQTKNGQTILVQSRWELVTNSANQHTLLVINTDVTENRSLEKQLFRAQRLESIGTLASGIAHDLNNILTPVVLGMELIKIRSNDDTISKSVDSMISYVQRGSGLIRQVLTFARGTEEKFDIINVKYSITEVVKMARETFPKEIEVNLNLPTEDLLIQGNATQIHQIILNLSINARDAMSQNGGELSIKAGYVDATESILRRFIDMKQGRYVAITVSDNGKGIPSALQEKIFEPFFTTKEVGKGTGIGLTTVFSIVRNHSGFMDFTSEENVGTSFIIYLPAEGNQVEDRIELPLTGRRKGQNKTLLLVDDEELLRTTAEEVLRAHGYKVLTAKNGEEAVHIYNHYQNEIEIVITDIVMPIMNGMELIKVLFSINKGIRIIATGGLLYDEASTTIKEIGALEVLLKPYTATHLLESIERVLQMKI